MNNYISTNRSTINQIGGFSEDSIKEYIKHINIDDIIISKDFTTNETIVFFDERYIFTNDSFLIPLDKVYKFDDIENYYWQDNYINIDTNILHGIYLTGFLIVNGMIIVKTIHPMILEIIEIINS